MKRETRSRTLATLDCETDPFLHGRLPEAFLWDIYDGKTHYTFEHVSDVVAFLENKEWIVYAHNGGKFDYHMKGFLDALEPFAEVLIINGRLARFNLGLCEFRDSCNILPMKLEEYKKEIIDYKKFERGTRERHLEEITKYLHKDTEYLYQLVYKFRETYGNGLTLAGSAMRVWSERSGTKPPKSTPSFYSALQPYYYGGRVECFYKGLLKQPVTMIDINSAYPFAMLHEHPISTRFDVARPKIDEPIIPQSLYTLRGIAHGSLPFRDSDKGLIFPNDDKERRYRITGWELQAALDTHSLDMSEMISRVDFEETINFTKYIHYFYDIKKNSVKGSPEYIFAKLFQNSLYGKFGANPAEYKNHMVVDMKHVGAAICDGKEFGGELGPWALMTEPLEPEKQRYYNVATAASITGFVRAYLWRNLCTIQRTGRLIYCDTDSIIFEGDMPKSITISKELGEWSLEGHYIKGGIGGKKLYCLFDKVNDEWKKSCKGVNITPEAILKVCAGEEVTYTRDAPTYGYAKSPRFCIRRVKMT